jgi:hypothetical protein
MAFRFLGRTQKCFASRASEKGSALVQTLALVGMIGLVSQGLAEYTRTNAQAIRNLSDVARGMGLSEIMVGALRHPAACMANFNLDADGSFDKSITTAQINDSIANGTTFPVQLTLPNYNSLVFPSAGPGTDALMTDLGITVGAIDIRFTNATSTGFLAQVSSSLLTRRGLFSTDLVASGRKVFTVLGIEHNGAAITGCSIAGSARFFCEQELHCRYVPEIADNPGDYPGLNPCQCGVEEFACPAGQFLIRYSDVGAPVCGTGTLPAQCPAGSTLVDVASNGAPVCRQWPKSCVANPGALVWSNGASAKPVTCTNTTAVQLAPGETQWTGDFQQGVAPQDGIGYAFFRCTPSGTPNTVPTLVVHNAASTPQLCGRYRWFQDFSGCPGSGTSAVRCQEDHPPGSFVANQFCTLLGPAPAPQACPAPSPTGGPTPSPGGPTPSPGGPTPSPGGPTPTPGGPTPSPGGPTPTPGSGQCIYGPGPYSITAVDNGGLCSASIALFGPRIYSNGELESGMCPPPPFGNGSACTLICGANFPGDNTWFEQFPYDCFIPGVTPGPATPTPSTPAVTPTPGPIACNSAPGVFGPFGVFGACRIGNPPSVGLPAPHMTSIGGNCDIGNPMWPCEVVCFFGGWFEAPPTCNDLIAVPPASPTPTPAATPITCSDPSGSTVGNCDLGTVSPPFTFNENDAVGGTCSTNSLVGCSAQCQSPGVWVQSTVCPAAVTPAPTPTPATCTVPAPWMDEGPCRIFGPATVNVGDIVGGSCLPGPIPSCDVQCGPGNTWATVNACTYCAGGPNSGQGCNSSADCAGAPCAP